MRSFGKEKSLGYGWRHLPTWWPRTMKNTYDDLSNQWVSYKWGWNGLTITKNVKEEDLAQVCAWVDYHYSEEYDILKSWGPPSFYTGIGKDRRFKPAYKDLESYQAYGVAGGKDGLYYGVMANSFTDPNAGNWNPEIQAGTFSLYPLSPKYVYPRVKKPGTTTFDSEMLGAWAGYLKEPQMNFFPQRGWSEADFASLQEFDNIHWAWAGGDPGAAIVKAITDLPRSFESNYAAYQKAYPEKDMETGMQEYQLKWKEIFDKYIRQYWK
jgi:hypothetical protein